MTSLSKKTLQKTVALATALMIFSTVVFAQAEATADATTQPKGDGYDSLRYALVAISALMLFIIIMLGNGIKAAAGIYAEKQKEKKNESSAAAIITTLLLLCSINVFAQAEPAVAIPAKPSLPSDLYIFFTVIAVEFLVILAQVWLMYWLFGIFEKKRAMRAAKAKKEKTFFQKINNTVPLEKEHTLDMDHNYDGIRELDNKVPGWWQLAFAFTMLFAVIYLYRMFISEGLPTQFQELTAANEIAAEQKEAYLKKAANNVDENTVKMMDASGISAGSELFVKNCVACHGEKGKGNIGPNLTDDYWLHKGDLKDIFYSIKYGWAEKGMKSWKEDFSPSQIAELASYIKSLRGSNPEGAKEKQGELFTDSDSSSVK